MRLVGVVKSLVLVVSVLSLFTVAFGMSEEEKSFLSLYFKDEELVILSATRSLKSITRVAENVEVVTKEDIELMNAHTLADVLNTVNGVGVSFAGASPGSIASPIIQGSEAGHVVVFIDGIAINFIASDQADLTSLPVQIVDKVEVIKGPASSVWGSSLGGVVNVITKLPGNKQGLHGTFSASYGEKNTGDFRAEAFGNKGSFGYYLYAGRLQTAGLRPVEEVSFNNVYTKFAYDVTDRTKVGVSFFYNEGDREEGDFSSFDFSATNRVENLFATVNLNSYLAEGLDLNLSLRAARQRSDLEVRILSTGDSIITPLDDRKYGASGRLTWKTGAHSIVIGSDYDHKKEISTIYVDTMPTLNVFAVYVNDTIKLNRFSITPGIRFDHTDRQGDFTSPGLGLTFDVADKTLVRAAVARGFQLPNLGATVADGLFFIHNPDLKPEKVWSYQAGVESGLLKYLWLKVSAFRHDIRDAIVDVLVDPDNFITTAINAEKVRRQGFEAEMRTMKFYNFTASAAAFFVHSENLTLGEDIVGLPEYTYDLVLKYDDEKSFRGLLRGRYVWWNLPGDFAAKYDAFVFDINLIKTLFRKQDRICELFLTGHNIFNGSQYSDGLFKNASRWIEAGLRYKF